MPELPEVETVVRGIKPYIQDKQFSNILVRRSDLRIKLCDTLPDICSFSKILDVQRRSKYVLIFLENNYVLVIHLGMSGKLTVSSDQQYSPLKHDHVIFDVSDGNKLIFNDPRRFGLVTHIKKQDLSSNKLFTSLGVEPLTNDLNPDYLYNKLKNRIVPIKQAIMNANIVVGVGNIYACESLFESGICPTRQSGTLSLQEVEKLIIEIKKVLTLAIKAGGSTLKDYAQSSGESGYFQHNFKVYGKEQQNCTSCNLPIIRIRQSGRSTFFCSSCQK